MVKNIFTLLEEFELENSLEIKYESNIEGFKDWISFNRSHGDKRNEPYLEGKENGRSAASVINTLIVHLNNKPIDYERLGRSNKF